MIDVTGDRDVLQYQPAEGHAENQANCRQLPACPDVASAELCPEAAATDSRLVRSGRFVASWFPCSPVRSAWHRSLETLTVGVPEPWRCQTGKSTTSHMQEKFQWQSLFVAQSYSVEPDRRSFALRQFLPHASRTVVVQIIVSETPWMRLEPVRMRTLVLQISKSHHAAFNNYDWRQELQRTDKRTPRGSQTHGHAAGGEVTFSFVDRVRAIVKNARRQRCTGTAGGDGLVKVFG